MVLVELDEGREEALFGKQDVVDLRVHVGSERQVEHGDEGLLHAGLAFNEGIAVDRGRDPLEDGVEKLGVEAADVAQGDGRARLQRFVELRGLPLLVGLAAEVLRRAEEDSQQVVDSLEGRELLPC